MLQILYETRKLLCCVGRIYKGQKSRVEWGLPNLLSFCWATNIRNLKYWFTAEAPQSRLKLEANSVFLFALNALLHTTLPCSISKYTNNVVVAASIKIWNQFQTPLWPTKYNYWDPTSRKSCFTVPPMIAGQYLLFPLGIKTLRDLYVGSASYTHSFTKKIKNNLYILICI